MKKGLWKSSLVSLTMLGSLVSPLIVSGGSAVMADVQPQSVYVATGDNGLSASVGKSYVNASRPSLTRAYRALGDPSKVGDSIDQKADLATVKQVARQSLEAYGQKGSDYLGDQNLSDQAKSDLQAQLKQVLTIADANLDQAKTLNQVQVALNTGAYGVLAVASSTTVSQAKTDTNAAQTAEKNVGNDSTAMATGSDSNKIADLVDSTDADNAVDVNTNTKSDSSSQNSQLQKSLDRLSESLDHFADAQNKKANDNSSSDSSKSSSDSSSGSNKNANNNQNNFDKSDADSESTSDNGEKPGQGKNFESVQAMIQYLNSQHGKDKLDSVKGATVETNIKMTHKAEGDYKTIFADNDGTLFLSKTGYNNIKPGQKVKVTIDSVSEGSANSPLGESIGWYDYTITFSDLNIVNDSGSGNKAGQNSGSQAGNNGQNGSSATGTQGQTGNTASSQPATSGNAPTGSVIPQTGLSRVNAWLSAAGVSLLALLGIGVSRRHEN